MTASLETLVVAAYVFADALPIPRPGPRLDHRPELIALAVAQPAMGERSDRKPLGVCGPALAQSERSLRSERESTCCTLARESPVARRSRDREIAAEAQRDQLALALSEFARAPASSSGSRPRPESGGSTKSELGVAGLARPQRLLGGPRAAPE